MTISEQKTIPLIQEFEKTRNATLELVKTLERDDFVVQTEFFTSPPKWHIGHVSWIYEVILSKIIKNYEFYSTEFSKYLNSYYQQFGEPQDKSKRGVVTQPTLEQIFDYFHIVNQRVKDFLQTNQFDDESSRLIIMGFHHECQHQELLVYDLQHSLADKYKPVKKNTFPIINNVEQKSITINEGPSVTSCM